MDPSVRSHFLWVHVAMGDDTHSQLHSRFDWTWSRSASLHMIFQPAPPCYSAPSKCFTLSPSFSERPDDNPRGVEASLAPTAALSQTVSA